MRISPINNNQNSFQAVNQKYYQWAQREAKGSWRFGELLTQLEMDVCWKNIHPQDAMDTLKAIKEILPENWKGFETTIEYVKHHLDLMKK